MQKFIIFLIIYTVLGLGTSAKSHYSEVLNKIEGSIFGVQYSKQSDTERLNRIEQNVYGKISSEKNIKLRIQKLSEDISADVFGQEIQPKEDTFAQDEPIHIEGSQIADNNASYSTEDVEYSDYSQPKDFEYQKNMPKYEPKMNFAQNTDEKVLKNLEKKFLKREYSEDNIERRISRLEYGLFNTNFTEDNVETRLDRLSSVYAAQKSSKKYDSMSKHLSTAVQIGTMLLMVALMIL